VSSPRRRLAALGIALVAGPALSAAADEGAVLPRRVRRIVLHALGGPSYGRPERRFVFFSPEQTHALWPGRLGTPWIVWTDGSLWRHPRLPGPRSVTPPVGAPADRGWRALLARDAAPVFSHVHDANTASLGIELAHSGRSDDPFPEAQVRSLRWLLETLIGMSRGRLGPAAIVGHKDLDRRPAFAHSACQARGCPVFVDGGGRPFRRRVDPPESLFRALAGAGLAVPREGREGDAELLRAESLAPGTIPPTLAR
jgi:N-acetylmuramoyl-L-alanine amidase